MKSALYILIIALFLTSSVLAQSGRRGPIVRTTPTPVPQVQVTQDVTESTPKEPTGYSESAPNSARNISVKNREENKKKKDKEAKQQPKPTGTQQPTSGTDDSEEIVRVDTALVTVPVSVIDRNGFYVRGLNKNDFKIFEDGVEQQIAYYNTSDAPITVVLLIDVSPSTQYKIEEIQAAAMAFVAQLKPNDKVIVIEFGRSVKTLAEATTDRAVINKAIQKADFGSGTSLYDAVEVALSKKLNKIEGRKAIVLFTDGVDTTSTRSTFEETIHDAEESEAVIFPIYYNTFLDNIGLGGGNGPMSTPPTLGLPGGIGGSQGIGISAEEYRRGRAYLNELANISGGKLVRPDNVPGGLTSAFEKIAEELSRQYNIGYYPEKTGSPGERRQIKVRIERPNLVIRTRDSYIVGG